MQSEIVFDMYRFSKRAAEITIEVKEAFQEEHSNLQQIIKIGNIMSAKKMTNKERNPS